jgi:hypothetical protein
MIQEQMKLEIDRAIQIHWDKMVQDHKRITSYNHEMWEDLLNFCLTEFLGKKSIEYQYKVAVTDNALPNYMGRSMSLNLRSSTSPFWTQYRREGYNSRGVYEVEEMENQELYYIQEDNIGLEIHEIDPYECVVYHIDKLNFYDKQIINHHLIDNWTIKKISEHYNIPINGITKDIKRIKSKLKEHCKHLER